MQIHFIKNFPWGEPSFFIEKIWSGFALNDFLQSKENGNWSTEIYKEKFPYDYDWVPVFMKAKPKIHTIRDDKHDRWKPSKLIHFEQWTDKAYKSKCYHFAPLAPCVGVQKIRIELIGSHKHKDLGASVFIDDIFQYMDQIEKLAQNDGFKSVDDFFKWFNKDYSGKIIHWTDLIY
jgi:hypothetical protein